LKTGTRPSWFFQASFSKWFKNFIKRDRRIGLPFKGHTQVSATKRNL
jgi:hypothetical protein